MQIEIKQVITKYKQLISNIGIFEVKEITWLDSSVSSLIATLLRKLALQIKSKKFLGQKLFMAIKRNSLRSFILFYRKKFYEEVSTITNHIPEYFLKLHGEGILVMFD